ncbi:hypothetical protein D6D02_02914, partial [Aureobasidium pullulans]
EIDLPDYFSVSGIFFCRRYHKVRGRVWGERQETCLVREWVVIHRTRLLHRARELNRRHHLPASLDPHQSPTCQTNHTTTSPEPHQIHQTNSTRYLRPQPAQPPSPPRKKNGSPTQRGNGRSHYNSLSCFSQWSSYHTWANTLAARPHTGDGPNTWSGNTLCISRSQILVSSRASVPSKPPPPC